MRGKEDEGLIYQDDKGITPAYAGKRFLLMTLWLCVRDHPRVCGEKLLGAAQETNAAGSPPRMRGKAPGADGRRQLPGITPAYAGKRDRIMLTTLWRRDHPRVCGEKCADRGRPHHDQGSPPRMRGKVAFRLREFVPDGITPAYAGKSVRRMDGG